MTSPVLMVHLARRMGAALALVSPEKSALQRMVHQQEYRVMQAREDALARFPVLHQVHRQARGVHDWHRRTATSGWYKTCALAKHGNVQIVRPRPG